MKGVMNIRSENDRSNPVPFELRRTFVTPATLLLAGMGLGFALALLVLVVVR